jgi:hypothetical protein
MNKLAMTVATGLVLGAANVGPASAMPAANLAAAMSETSNVQNVVWVCGPFRCWWRPNYWYYPRVYRYPRVYSYGYVAPYWGYRYFRRPYYGFYRGWW